MYFFKKILYFTKCFVVVFLILSLFGVVFFSYVNPPFTYLMLKRCIDQKLDNKEIILNYKWKDIDEISNNVVLAVIASEDNKFKDHIGVDFEAIKKAQKHNIRSKRIRGASTITQQTAKNLFLWPKRSFIRKGFELYFTFLIEIVWSKKRIIEVYLNIIETGNGIYGLEAAAKKYFNKESKYLTRSEAALIAALLPNPRKRNPLNKSNYLIKRQQLILTKMSQIGKVSL